MCRAMELQGLAPMVDNDGLIVWSSMPQIGGAPYYFAHMMANTYGAQIAQNCRKQAMDVVSKREERDGIDHILGSNGALPAGRMALQVISSKTDFAVNCDEEDQNRREFLEAAGWLPIKNMNPRIAAKLGTQPYRTRDPFIAGNLEAFMSEPAKKLMRQKLKEAGANIKASKSHTDEGAMDVPAPDGLGFFPFQRKGITMAVESPGGTIIADDMGLGKTMQGIGVINAKPEAKRILVISQANMRIKWGQEIEKWKVDPDKTVGVAESSNFPDTDVCVINYDILSKNIAAIRAVDWDIIICDEAHNLKNPEAQRTQAVLGDLLGDTGVQPIPLSENGCMVHLTGTPKPNRIDELWPLISSTRPDIWGSGPEDAQIFRNRYCPPVLIKKQMPSKYKGGKPREIIIPMPGKPIRETELHLRLRGSGSFVRRMKRDNPDLPPKFRTPLDIPVRLSKEEKEALRSVEFDLQEMLDKTKGGKVREGETTMAGAVISQITQMNPDTPAFHEMARVRRNLGLIKAPHCAKFILDELEAEKDFAPENRTKTVVFAHHKDVIKVIKAEADKRMKGAFLVYDGSVGSAKKKQDLVDRFQTDDKIRGMIISLSGNSGITLTEAARMRVVEPDWSPSNMIQIEDRIWRIGQMKNVDIGYMSVAGTLDARIGMAIAAKMETDEKSINSISFQHKAPSQKGGEIVNEASRSALGAGRQQMDIQCEGDEEQVEQSPLPLFD
jgi:SWI/SNF-related matrix-associated actin-dependent regulator 1 of chromatin subfamily A